MRDCLEERGNDAQFRDERQAISGSSEGQALQKALPTCDTLPPIMKTHGECDFSFFV